MTEFEVDNIAEPSWGVQIGPGTLRTHAPDKCAGQFCVIHNPSEHHMRDWPLNWRADLGLMERICGHGVGHPDWDALAFEVQAGRSWLGTHGCCGCCACDGEIEGLPARSLEPGYLATSDGRIWSKWRTRGPSHGNVSALVEVPRAMKGRPNGRGYLRVHLRVARDKYVHRLVWEAFRGPVPRGLQVRHLDGDKTNNVLRNLATGTQSDNEADKDRHGTRPVGQDHSNSRLTAEAVRAARIMFVSGHSLSDTLASLDISVSKSTLHEAITGKTWAWIQDVEPVVGRGR